MISFGIIASAGQARTPAFEALKKAKEHDFEAAEGPARAEQGARASEAHHVQTQLLSSEASEHTVVDVMLCNAQDHLMTSMIAQELVEEIVNLCRELDATRARRSNAGGMARSKAAVFVDTTVMQGESKQ